MSGDGLFKDKYRIKSIRLPEWDYGSEGAYFITICVKNRECVFGEIINRKICLSKIGETVQTIWNETPHHFDNVKLDGFIVMPNNVHGVVIINNDHCRDVACNISTENIMSRISPKSKSLPTIIRSFKSAVTKKCDENGLYFSWQPRYYEHIIRNENELNSIRKYIINNPLQWELDRNNPQSLKNH